jgi:hypothetical protein
VGSEEDPPAESGEPEQVLPADEAQAISSPEENPALDAPPARRPGSMRHQDPETTRARPVTVAELRAREKYTGKQLEIEEARLKAQAKRRARTGRIIGATAAVGAVGGIAGLGYLALSPDRVTAQCVREDAGGQPVVVSDYHCTDHTVGPGGFFFYGGHSYRYYYGSSGSIGSRPIGGTTVAPKGATITTKSGSTIRRGGLGTKFRGGGGS